MFFSLRPLSMPSSVLPKLATFTLSLHLLFEPQPYNFSTVVCLIHFFKSVFKNLTSKKKRTSLLYIASSYSVKFLKYQFCYLTVSVFNIHENVQFSCSVVSDSLRPRGLQHARPPCPSPTPGVYSKLMSIESLMPSNHLILCCSLLLPPSIFPSIRVFSNESVLHIRWPKYWSFSFSISRSNDYSGLISFRMDWLDLLAVPGTLKSLLQHYNSKASILQCSAFFMV